MTCPAGGLAPGASITCTSDLHGHAGGFDTRARSRTTRPRTRTGSNSNQVQATVTRPAPVASDAAESDAARDPLEHRDHQEPEDTADHGRRDRDLHDHGRQRRDGDVAQRLGRRSAGARLLQDERLDRGARLPRPRRERDLHVLARERAEGLHERRDRDRNGREREARDGEQLGVRHGRDPASAAAALRGCDRQGAGVAVDRARRGRALHDHGEEHGHGRGLGREGERPARARLQPSLRESRAGPGGELRMLPQGRHRELPERRGRVVEVGGRPGRASRRVTGSRSGWRRRRRRNIPESRSSRARACRQ